MNRRAFLGFVCSPLCAADWPRFGGPNGDFAIAPPEPPLAWSSKGPGLLWKSELGPGYSEIVVDGSSLYTMFRRDETREVVVCLDAQTGKTLWEFSYDAPLPDDYDRSHGTGPRATPLIDGNFLFTIGAGGQTHCFDRTTRKVVWKCDLISDFHGSLRVNGYAPSPISWRDTVIVMPNAPGAAIAALRKSTGEVVWKKHSYVVSYATPLIVNSGGHGLLIAQFSDEVTGLDPDTGELLWSHPHANDQKVNVASPIWFEDGRLFLSCAYSGAAKMLRVNRTAVEELWSQRLVRIHFSNPVRIGNTIYASTGDLGPTPLSATDIATGRVLWRDRSITRSSLLAVGTQLLVLDEDGTLALASPTATGVEVRGRLAILASPSWTAPTFTGRRIYARDLHSIVALAWSEGA